MEAETIERIAEELGVNFYDLHPLLSARDEFHIKEGRREVVEWIEDNCDIGRCDPVAVTAEWQAQKKRWGIEKK